MELQQINGDHRQQGDEQNQPHIEGVVVCVGVCRIGREVGRSPGGPPLRRGSRPYGIHFRLQCLLHACQGRVKVGRDRRTERSFIEIGFGLGFFQDGFNVLRQNEGAVQQPILDVCIQNPDIYIFFQHAGQDKFPFHTIKNIIGLLIIRNIDKDVDCLPDGWVIAQGAQHIRLHGNLPGLLRQAALLEPDAPQFQEGLIHCADAADRLRAHNHSIIRALSQLIQPVPLLQEGAVLRFAVGDGPVPGAVGVFEIFEVGAVHAAHHREHHHREGEG